MTCPDPERLTGFVDDTLIAEDRSAIEEHLDTCEDCRSLVAVLAQAATAEQEHERASLPVLVRSDGPEFAATLVAAPGEVSSPNPTTTLATGTKVGRYEIFDVIGVGGMGVVYAARDPQLHREVAIKLLRSDFTRTHPDASRRITREARAMAKLSHPNVVAIYDVGEYEDQVFVAMERVSGSSLREWLKTPRSLSEILDVFIAAGRGLAAAHDVGIVHRDFKPDNVLVGTDGRARVTDFGLAFAEDDEDTARPVDARAIAGTPAYMAPEQHAGDHVDARSDQFGFAIALYEALYGSRPFSATSREALIEDVRRGLVAAPPPRSRVPTSLRRILLRALAVTPGDRFPTLHDLLKALARDRGRRPRQVAYVALVGFLICGVAFGADAILRERARAVTRTSFAAARTQLDKLVASRTETFIAQSDALYLLPAVQAAASADFADFGLGNEEEDRARRQLARDTLFSQSWLAATRLRAIGVVAVADQKGRLLYSSANTQEWGNDIRHVPVVAAAYEARSEVYLGVVKGDDPHVVRSKLLGIARPDLFVVFARTRRINDQPRVLFMQLVEAKRVLAEVGSGTDTLLSITALGNIAEGEVPIDVVARAGDGGMTEMTIDGAEWIAQRTPLSVGEHGEAIAQLVLARHTDVGLAGLFPYARIVLAFAGFALGAIAAGGLLLARRRR